MKRIIQLFSLLMVVSLFSSCVSKKKFTEMEALKMELDKKLAQAESDIKDLTTEKETLMSEKSGLESQVAQIQSDLEGVKAEVESVKGEMQKAISAKDAEIASVKGQINSAFSNLRTSGLSIRQDGDMFYVSMEEQLLFRSGSTRINKSGRDILSKLAEIVKGNSGMTVMVEGHTDTQKLKDGAAYATNWELSTARATSVVRRLIKNGVSAANLVAAGRGEHDPAVAGTDAAARKANRRVEFAIVPNVGQLYNMK